MAVQPNDTYAARVQAGTLSGRHDTKYAVPDDSVSLIKEVLTGSKTWDPANMSTAGSFATTSFANTTVTVTGAAVGDLCNASLSTLTTTTSNGAILTARVTAADTVRVDLWNQTGAALDVASGTLKAVVFKL